MQKVLENYEAGIEPFASAPRTAFSSRQKDDFTQFIIRRDFGKVLGTGWVDAEASTEAEVAQDIIDGQFDKVLQIVAFNIAEGWSRDVSEDIARLIFDTLNPSTKVSRNLIDFLEEAGSIRLVNTQAAE